VADVAAGPPALAVVVDLAVVPGGSGFPHPEQFGLLVKFLVPQLGQVLYGICDLEVQR